ncbi:D-tyrosyl-tRNA(Tyr) deacylase [Streptomyces sp. WMMB 714]|uniref:D-aminoacyl-tRNA deacylase n=1 Tax=Streptomyces sp. WMMB 714 TaxID=1286822 RepID=UPI000823ECAF|nr:D-aminoacyl-tRNA deacylase [Streptomyces sp. WMMB 714]SCK50371.1 D-tyrosyl-tRNA(Tyr) deacylase [Streptomyces sp. WMMB 714]
MRAVVQRVNGASVVVEADPPDGTAPATVGEITGEGLCVLVGVTHEDTDATAARLAAKLWSLRILDGEKSCSDVGAPLLVVSQFTLYGDARKGRRPTWNAAAPGDVAEPLVDEVVAQLRKLGAEVATGRFGAKMRVSLTNDGPFTVLLEI